MGAGVRLPWGLKWLCAHMWRQATIPCRYPAWNEVEWVCVKCRKRTVKNMADPPLSYEESHVVDPGDDEWSQA